MEDIYLGYICYGLFHSNIFDNKYEDGIYMINEDNDDITVYKVVDKRVADSDIYEIIREEIYGINTKKPEDFELDQKGNCLFGPVRSLLD